MVNIGCQVNYGSADNSYTDPYCYDKLSQVWCRPCVEKLNIHKPREKQTPKEVKQQPNPTTEEILVSLLEQLGFMREH